MRKLYIDLETRSRADLTKTGVYRYVEDPDFRILMAAWSTDGENVRVAVGQTEINEIPGLWDAAVLKIAHNAQFERVCLSRFNGLPTGQYLDPEEWHDTAAVAGELGYPQQLEALGKVLGGEQKDKSGKNLINLFCKPNRKGEFNGPEAHPDEWLDFIMYCGQDVHTLIDVDRRLGDWPGETERQVWIADQHINDRGMAVDMEMARLAVVAAEENRMLQELEISSLTKIVNPGSQQQMLKWLNEEGGLNLKNLQKATVENLLRGDLDPTTRRVLELRKELALVAAKKYTSALVSVSDDDRLRGGFRFFGAHTGRWTGRGLQPHNLPRAALETPAHTEAAIVDLKMGLGGNAHTLKALVRALFTGPLAVVDYASIEARVLAWLAGEEWALEAFRAGRDIYVETAERIGGLTRAQGKVAVLALGYAGGIGSLKVMGGADLLDDEDRTEQRVDLYLQSIVDQWRAANKNITRLWTAMGNAFSDGGPVGEHLSITRTRQKNGQTTVTMHLPSGRVIQYHDVRWERYRVIDPITERPRMKEGWRYRDPRGFGRIGTYGGRLVENATQAAARDVLAEALVRLKGQSYDVVGHVHDEILVAGNHSVENVTKVMVQPPYWADGLPIDAEGFQCSRYRKG